MTKTIWKHDFTDALTSIKGVTLKLPAGAKILRVDLQGENFCLWEEHNTAHNENLEERTFRIFGTGWEFESKEVQVYLGTIFEGPYVWHIYEEE